MTENQNIEWKENWKDDYLKWVCGFANAKGGKIFIGKNDKGKIVGISNAKRLMDDIPNKIQTQLGIICDVDLNENEGKLPAGMTIEDLKKKHSSRPHNPILASAFFKGGLIEAWGRGTIKIINEYKKAGLSEPIIESVSGGISVTILKNKNIDDNNISYKELNERQVKAIEFVKSYGKITNKEYQRLNKISRETATLDLKHLVKIKLLKSSGSKGAGAFYTLK